MKLDILHQHIRRSLEGRFSLHGTAGDIRRVARRILDELDDSPRRDGETVWVTIEDEHDEPYQKGPCFVWPWVESWPRTEDKEIYRITIEPLDACGKPRRR